MTRRFRHIALLTMLVVVCTAVLSWPSLLKYIVQSSLTNLRAQGHALSWSGVSTSMTSINLEQASGWLSVPAAQRNGKTIKVPVTLDLQQLSVGLRGTSLLSLSPSFPFTVALYGGRIAGEAQLLTKEPVVAIEIDNVELGRHPQLAALGIQGGVITASTKGLRIKQQGAPEGSFTITLSNLTPPAALTPKEQTVSPGPLSVHATGGFESDKLAVELLDISSPLGSIESTGTVSGLSGSPCKFSASSRIAIAETTISSLAPQMKYVLGDERFPDIDLSWKGTLEGTDLSLDVIKVATTLGSADGKAKIGGLRAPVPSVDGHIRINLSERGVKTIGKWLPLLTGGAVESSATTFRINFLSTGCEQPGAQRVFGRVCLKPSFME